MRFEPVEGLVLARAGPLRGDSYFSDDANTPALRIEDYFLASAQASYEVGPARLFIYATNVFDKFVMLQ